jgi:cyclic peptide transporter
MVYDLRMRLINKIFLTSYQLFERMERGRVFATLSEDTGQVARIANVLSGLVTSFITATCAFIYLFTIAFWAAAVTLFVVGAIASLYYYVSGKARAFFEIARDTRNDYMELLNGLLDGFKELSLRYNKRKKYTKELDVVTDTFSTKMGIANIKFINSFLVGESLLLVVLGAVSFAIPRLFPEITTFTLMSFIMVLLYLIGPVNVILNAIPTITQIRVAWGRVIRFERDIPADIERGDIPNMGADRSSVKMIKAKGVKFSYKSDTGEEAFSVGPIDFEARRGEITFIIGGNGSGKTTLAKLLTGLYSPDEGYIQIEGKEIDNQYPGEYFSTVFTGFHLFRRLYDVDENRVLSESGNYIKMLQLEDKVSIEDGKFTTIDLSGGQKKRLALLRCYLEDAPIYLFDEVAADQDPEFRKFFYRDLLQRMKKEGKIVIAITHDDHYFDVADRIVKMDMGKFVTLDADTTIRVTK